MPMIKTVVTQCDIGGERVATLVICTSTELVHRTWVAATLPLIRLCVQSKYEALFKGTFVLNPCSCLCMSSESMRHNLYYFT